MKKKYIYILLITVLIFTIIYITKNNTKTFNIDGVNYAVTVNGKEDNKFPEKGPYKVDLECESGTGVWNYEEWIAEIYDVQEGNVYCNLSFTNENVTKLNDYIIDLFNGSNSVSASTKSPSDGSTLEKITEHGEEDYRYRGIDPNNYIKFNNELWRIIGVFDDNTHSITNTHLVKIIRNNSIGGYYYNTLAFGQYSVSHIYKLLNIAYYNHIDATKENYCMTGYSEGKCDFTKIGIQDEYKNMIEDKVNWFLGESIQGASTASNMYKSERGDTLSPEGKKSTYASGLTTPIGIMYASDYGYASPSSCTKNLSSYHVAGCADKNWLYSGNYEFLINKSYTEGLATYHGARYTLNVAGNVQSSATTDPTKELRPTLYLKSDVYYLSGIGTQTDPYIIGM